MSPQQYLECYSNYFWLWDAEGEIITINGGNTLAYTQYVGQLLNQIKKNGIPRFGSLLIALAVTDRYNAKANFANIKSCYSELLYNSNLDDVFRFLEEITNIPNSFKTGSKRVQFLYTLLFKNHNGVSTKKSEAIIKELELIAQNGVIEPINNELIRSDLAYKDILAFEILQRHFKNAQGVIDAMANYDYDFPELALEQTPIESTKVKALKDIEPTNFIEELSLNYKTYKIGNLIKSIWSGLNIPYHSIQPSNQPLGGVADISNKGNFDQLLISEFANDELTFLSRLANNEALYLEREVPPENNPYERIFLVDTSLRNWGIPKTIALAISIAIAQHPKNNFKCKTILLGHEPLAINLESIEDVISAQLILNSGIHSAEQIRTFFSETALNPHSQVFYIGSKEGLRHNEMTLALAEFRNKIDYKIILDQIGGVSVYKTQGVSQRHVQDFIIDVHKHWENTPKTQDSTRLIENELFDIENTKPPLLVSVSNQKGWVVTEQKAFFSLSKNGIFLHRGDINKQWHKGFEFIGFKPLGQAHEIGITSKNEIVLLSYLQNKKVELHNFSTGNTVDFMFPYHNSISHSAHQPFGPFAFYNDAFYYTGAQGWKILLNGSIRADNSFDPEFCPFRLKFYREKSHFGSTISASVLRNLNSVYINERNNLVLNKHELITNSNNGLRFKISNNTSPKVEAEYIKPNLFQFKNGSQLYLNPAGFMVFKPKGDKPSIFAPTTLNKQIALATKKHFAGNEYYLKGKKIELHYELNKNSSKLEIIRSFKQVTNADLAESKIAVEQMPGILYFDNEQDAAIMKKSIDKLCSTTKIERPVSQQIILNTNAFEMEYLTPALRDILNYESQS